MHIFWELWEQTDEGNTPFWWFIGVLIALYQTRLVCRSLGMADEQFLAFVHSARREIHFVACVYSVALPCLLAGVVLLALHLFGVM